MTNESPRAMAERRRLPFVMEKEKFTTQRAVTYFILFMLGTASVFVFLYGDKAERSAVLTTILNLAVGTFGFWIGTSKGSADKDAALSRIAEASAPTAAAAAAAAGAASAQQQSNPIKTDEVKIEAETATVTTEAQPKATEKEPPT